MPMSEYIATSSQPLLTDVQFGGDVVFKQQRHLNLPRLLPSRCECLPASLNDAIKT